MSDKSNNMPKPGPNRHGANGDAKGVNKFLSRFGPVQENEDRVAPGPRADEAVTGRATAQSTSPQDPATESLAGSSNKTATLDLPAPLFDNPGDSVFDDVPAGAGTWTDPDSPPESLFSSQNGGAIFAGEDLEIIPDVRPVEVIDRRDWVRVPRRTGPVFRFLLVGFVAVLAIGTVYNRVDTWVSNQFDPVGDPGEFVDFEIASGATSNEVTQQLFAQDVIANPTLFRYWVSDNLEGDFQAGQYNCLQENMSFEEARDCLINEGPVAPTFFSVTIPEGLRLTEIIDVLNAENPQFSRAALLADLDASIVSVNLDGVPATPLENSPDPTGTGREGLLFPATYQIDERDQGDTRDILARMADQMEIEFSNAEAEVGRASVVQELGLTDYEVLTVASLIEEEARLDGDRGRISRVIYNRLAAGNFSLGIDATSCYAAAKPCADLTIDDLNSDSPWNTRNTSNFGLPPTPIASPGAASIRAALNPEPGDWLWYVLTDPSGAHTFANTEGEFSAAVQVCRNLDLGC